MTAIPRPALFLGLAGVIPFAVAALSTVAELHLPGPNGAAWAQHYGTVILAFMSGVLWGFATRAEGKTAAQGYVLSVIPALWAFFTTIGRTDVALIALIFGFAGLLALDHWFWRRSLAPGWWMQLRLLLTSIVILCLLVVLIRA